MNDYYFSERSKDVAKKNYITRTYFNYFIRQFLGRVINNLEFEKNINNDSNVTLDISFVKKPYSMIKDHTNPYLLDLKCKRNLTIFEYYGDYYLDLNYLSVFLGHGNAYSDFMEYLVTTLMDNNFEIKIEGGFDLPYYNKDNKLNSIQKISITGKLKDIVNYYYNGFNLIDENEKTKKL